MQLRKAKALRVLDHHQAGIRHIDADFDHRRRYQHLHLIAGEGGHHGRLIGGLQATMHEADDEIGQLFRKPRISLFGRLELQCFAFLDQRTHPVRLPANATGIVHAADHLVAARCVDQFRHHRRAAGRQFVEHRNIEIGVVAHRQRARDRRCRHRELMCALSLLLQRQPLLHAKAMLLIDDGKTEPIELDAFLDQRVRADRDWRTAATDFRAPCFAFLLLHAGSEPRHFDAERRQPGGKLAVMLLGEDFRRRHQRRLVARLHRLQHRQRRDHGLAATDVAL